MKYRHMVYDGLVIQVPYEAEGERAWLVLRISGGCDWRKAKRVLRYGIHTALGCTVNTRHIELILKTHCLLAMRTQVNTPDLSGQALDKFCIDMQEAEDARGHIV